MLYVQLNECNERLLKIQVPHEFSRSVKGLDQIKLWKGMMSLFFCCCFMPVTFFLIASDYRSWVLYFSLPVLHGKLEEPYFSHYALLVAAMHILLSQSIPKRSLVKADRYLQRFCETFASLYGQ